MTDASQQPLLSVRKLTKHFDVSGSMFSRERTIVRAVDGISFDIAPGETLGLVGESGCGKSTTGRTILRLEEATSGEVLFEGRDVMTLARHELRSLRRRMQIVFQDPYSSLDPRKTVAAIVAEPLIVHNLAPDRLERDDRVVELLQTVGLSRDHLGRYPHEFSGGQRQRIGIARALAVEPKFIVCDEPISALDVSIQAQIINLLEELQEKLGLTYLFIAHDLAVVRHISDRVAVMYVGKMVEVTDRNEIFENPLHPYTRALLSSIPIPDPVLEKRRTRMILIGDVPSPVNPPTGCRFNPRCPYAEDNCRTDEPPLAEVRAGHWVACHYWDEVENGSKRITNNTEIVREGDLPAIPSATNGASLN
jgi:oligopeptide/dipeptide ABC transporter ATP-binding protein